MVETKEKSGFKDTLTPQQEEILAELRNLVCESEWGKSHLEKMIDEDAFLLRFLRATCKDKNHKRIFRAKEAYKRIEECFRFREKHKLDSYEYHKPHLESAKIPELYEEYLKVKPNYFWTDDKAKEVLVLERFALFASTVNSKDFETDEWEALSGHLLDRISHELHVAKDAHGHAESRGYVALIDAKGLGMGIFTRLGLIRMLNGIAAAHYPESIKSIHIVNTPWIFERAFAAIKPILDVSLKQKPYELLIYD